MRALFLIMSLVLLSACASSVPPLISKKNCKNTCIMKGMDYKDFDEEKGCYCGAYND